jgi:hypothetical protein
MGGRHRYTVRPCDNGAEHAAANGQRSRTWEVYDRQLKQVIGDYDTQKQAQSIAREMQTEHHKINQKRQREITIRLFAEERTNREMEAKKARAKAIRSTKQWVKKVIAAAQRRTPAPGEAD